MSLVQSVGSLDAVAVPIDLLGDKMAAFIAAGWRVGHLTARVIAADSYSLVAVMLNPNERGPEIWESALGSGVRSYPSLTHSVPAVHWFERLICDQFGVCPVGHPRFKSLILHEAWPEGFHPLDGCADTPPDAELQRRRYDFMQVRGAGVFEIPVGPIHAGIIEPGHFRFSCMGEVIQYLEIRLGYQHRGIERRLELCSPVKARLLAEATSTDTAAGNALAHALAIESLHGIEPAATGDRLRRIALEIERVACHIGDLGGICADIGFLAGSATFGRLRGRVLGMAERLTGTRFQSAYIVPGGVARPLADTLRSELIAESEAVASAFLAAEPLLLENYGALERMEGIGRIKPSLARDFGLVGPAGRASGIGYDVRQWQGLETPDGWTPASCEDGDVLARVRIRALEVTQSLEMIRHLLLQVSAGGDCRSAVPPTYPSGRCGVGLVEAWRGELIHLIFTDESGRIARYAIKDPSVNNWTGLALAVREAIISDFPVCNKSFGLSYSGIDL